jgi:hypothetical protein
MLRCQRRCSHSLPRQQVTELVQLVAHINPMQFKGLAHIIPVVNERMMKPFLD